MKRADLDAAVAALDRVLSDRPDAVYDDLVAATRCLIHLRDTLIAQARRGDIAAAARLRSLNAALSLVVAAEYPLEGVRKDRINAARREVTALGE